MDKYEYRVRADEIKALLAKRDYVEAMEVCNSIDWKRVKSISMLCTVSEIYKINRKYEDSRDILLLAYDRYPNGRMIVYALCELAIKMEEFVQAVEYYKEYLQIAPKDTGRYILQYKLYEAQDVSLEERIAVLEEFKKKDYREKWAYELAYLYHRIGLATKCVEECDELILWFGEGKFVQKAMELKMLHQPLSTSQQEKYDVMTGIRKENEFFDESEQMTESDDEEEIPEEKIIPIQIKSVNASKQPTQELPSELQEEGDIKIKPVNIDKYSTMNLQAELSKSMQELFDDSKQGVILQDVDEKEVPSETPFEESVNESDEEQEESTSDAEEIKLESEGIEETDLEEVDSEETDAEETNDSEPELNRILSQEYDGQISIVVPEPELVEKQITGQMDLTDVLSEWDRLKQENNRRRIAEAKRRSLEQTNDIVSQLVGVIPGVEKSPLPDVDAPEIIIPEEEKHYDYPEDAPQEVEEIPEIEDEFADGYADEETPEEDGELSEEEYFEDESEEYSDEQESEDDKFVNEESEDDESEDGESLEDEESEDGELSEDDEFEDGELSEDDEFEDGELSENDETEDGESLEDDETEDGELSEDDETEEEEASENEEFEDGESLEDDEDRQLEEIFGSMLHMHNMKTKIKKVLADSKMMAVTGNIIITGSEPGIRLNMALAIAKTKQKTDVDFIGKVAKISGAMLNTKDIKKAVAMLDSGALIIEKAGQMTINTLDTLAKSINYREARLLIILEDEKSRIRKLQKMREYFSKVFNVSIDIPTYSNDDLVNHAKEYALQREYTIDEMGILALYTRIDELQTAEHFVTIQEVEEIMDEAISHVDKKNMNHLMDVLFAKRYDEDDLIILREKDFFRKNKK